MKKQEWRKCMKCGKRFHENLEDSLLCLPCDEGKKTAKRKVKGKK